MSRNSAMNRNTLFLALVLVILSACGPHVESMTPTPASVPAASPTPTPTPPRELTVCLGKEPNTLFLYGNPNAAARSVLAALFDGPIDYVSYEYQPVILKKLPNLADGDATIDPLTVTTGEEVVGADGLPVTLDEGVRVRPSGCRSDSCAITYDGFSDLTMDQMTVTFTLKPGLTWSDGKPLTAEDSVYSYSLAADATTTGSKYLVDRTRTYEMLDEATVQWWGKPGFIDPTYYTNFWTPAPRQLWSEIAPADLPNDEVAAHYPLGWGPYLLDEWVTNDHITLLKNPLYFRAAEGLPKFDILTYKFISDGNEAVSALLAGQCDILDPSIPLEGQAGLLLALNDSDQVQIETSTSMIMERLDFGIQPASYDNGYSQTLGDRADFLSDKRMRQAIGMCLDRQKIVDSVLYGLSPVPDSFLPPDHPLFNANVTTYPFDVAKATRLLDQLGWKDTDNNPATPRVSVGVPRVTGGTPLVLDYWTTTAVQRQQVSEILTESLAQCGIQVNLHTYLPEELYAEGPDGPLFGRRFTLAEFAMGTAGVEPSCEWFTTSEIPTGKNHWAGVNISGYTNPAYDAACQAAVQALPDDPEFDQGYADTQRLFAEDLPSIPLYLHPKVAAARQDFCGFALDPTAAPFWNLEAFDMGAACTP